MADLYEEHLQGKQRRKGKVKGKRNPIASSHNNGNWNAGPMKSSKKDKAREKVDFRDYDESD